MRHIKSKREKHCFSLLWCHLESNQGHTDFQSVALPTELWHHKDRLSAAPLYFGDAKVYIFLKQQRKFIEFEKINFLYRFLFIGCCTLSVMIVLRANRWGNQILFLLLQADFKE